MPLSNLLKSAAVTCPFCHQGLAALSANTKLAGRRWYSSQPKRPVFAHVTRRVDTELGAETPNDVAYELRSTAVNSVISIGTPATRISRSGDGRTPLVARQEKFLDAEIVAIYW